METRSFKGGWGNQVFCREFKDVDFKQYSLIIVEEVFSWNPMPLLRFIREQNRSCKLLYWLRNTLFAEKYETGITPENIASFLAMQKRYDFHVVSFDPKDCRKYNLQYAPQCIPYMNWDNFTDEKQTYNQDVFWIGKDKGRAEMLLQTKQKFEEFGVKCKFLIFPKKHKKYSEDIKAMLLRGGELPYSEIVAMDLQSKAILDIVTKGQSGMTYRVIEAMNLKRKLITTLPGIRRYDFYRKENIFVLGEDSFSNLPDFLNSPYKELPSEIVEHYTFAGMLKDIYQRNNWDFSEIE